MWFINPLLPHEQGLAHCGPTAWRPFPGKAKKGPVRALIFTGKQVGVASHLYGVVVEDVPSFTIYARSLGQERVELKLESAVETARRMMSMRGLSMSKALEDLLKLVFELTRSERAAAGVKVAAFQLAASSLA